MLVDLARNDLSRLCDDVKVDHYREVQYYSHVIHLVSEVSGKVRAGSNPFALVAKTFPAGTLSGAPKFKAMELIDAFEPTARSYYGGAIGFMGFDGQCNHAIMIRTFMSRQNKLIYQAGAGVSSCQQTRKRITGSKQQTGRFEKSHRVCSGDNLIGTPTEVSYRASFRCVALFSPITIIEHENSCFR